MYDLRLNLIKLALVVVALAAIALAATALPARVAQAVGESAAQAAPVVASAAPSSSPSPTPPSELAGWGARRLAAQLVVCSVPATDPLQGRRWARKGVGGIVILGGGARSTIGKDLAAVLRAAPDGVKPFIASDEEGGQVQRLRDVIYPLPSARVQGGWSDSRTRATARGLRRPAPQAARLRGVRPGRGPGRPGPLHEHPRPVLLVAARTSSAATSWRG